jgi:hypothetical protein
MENNLNTAHRDRVDIEPDPKELSWQLEVAYGDCNRQLTVDAMEDGLMIDESAVLPWEWILKAAERLQIQISKSESP